MDLSFSGEVAVGDLLTASAIMGSALGLVATWIREIRLREVEHADRVKRAAASTLSKLERAGEIGVHFFDVFGGCFVPADRMMVRGRPAREITNYVWKSAELAAAECVRRLHDEEIELAYVDLYAYDREVYGMFTAAREEQDRIWRRTLSEAKRMAQDDIADFPHGRAGLGSELRETCRILRAELREEYTTVMVPLRQRLEWWIRASPRAIVRRRVTVRTAAERAPAAAPSPIASTVSSFVLGSVRLQSGDPGVQVPFSTLQASIERLTGPHPRIKRLLKRVRERPTSRHRQELLTEYLAPYHVDDDPGIRAAMDSLAAAEADRRGGAS